MFISISAVIKWPNLEVSTWFCSFSSILKLLNVKYLNT